MLSELEELGGLGDVSELSDADLKEAMSKILGSHAELKKNTQLWFYEAASPDAEKLHLSKAHTIGLGGGNRSSKTESCLVESMALATGVFPKRYEDEFRKKFVGPINVRLCIESLTTHLHPVLLPKLKWWKWTGAGLPGSAQGHWGWIPKMCLIEGEWEKSWREKDRMMTILCRDPDNLDRILGESTLQIMSYDQNSEDYASGTFHIIHMDEPPPFPIWSENKMRVMDVRGRLLLSMTWPDDPSIAVDWIYDECYEPGMPGPRKNEDIDWFILRTVNNKFINQESVALKAATMSDSDKKVRLEGQPLRFSNRIHPDFTDVDMTWCFGCQTTCNPVGGNCGCERQCTELCEFNHVKERKVEMGWPVMYLLDPHPRKPHFMAWMVIDPSDDLYLIEEAEVEGDAVDVASYVDNVEAEYGLNVRQRLMDPNMGASPTAKRDITWQDEFIQAGMQMELADKSEVGRKRVNQYLKPDKYTYKPRLTFSTRCAGAVMQMKRFVWGDYKRNVDKDIKQLPKDKYDDYPALLRYCVNANPEFRYLQEGPAIISRRGTRKGGY